MPSFSFIGYTLMELFRNLIIEDKFTNKQVRLFIHQMMCRKKQIIRHRKVFIRKSLRHNKVAKWLFHYLKKKNTEAATRKAEAVTGGVL